MCICVCAYAFVCGACAHVCACMCVCACACVLCVCLSVWVGIMKTFQIISNYTSMDPIYNRFLSYYLHTILDCFTSYPL